MNRVILMGRLTRDPDVRWTQGQDAKAIARLTLAVDRKVKADNQPSADFISCVAFGKVAEFIEKYINKGTKIVIEGRWQTGSYEKDGNKIYTNDCVIDSCEFAESKKSNDNSNDNQPAPQPAECGDGFMNIPDVVNEELPFV